MHHHQTDCLFFCFYEKLKNQNISCLVGIYDDTIWKGINLITYNEKNEKKIKFLALPEKECSCLFIPNFPEHKVNQ